jgi:hypothetical protein
MHKYAYVFFTLYNRSLIKFNKLHLFQKLEWLLNQRIVPHFNMYLSSSEMDAQGVQGGYTSLLLGVDQGAASVVKKLQFDGLPNNENI